MTQPFTAPLGVPVVTSGNQDQPAIAALAGGGYVVAWEVDGETGPGEGVLLQVYNAAGGRVGLPVPVAASAADQDEVALAGTSDGGFAAVWREGATVRLQRYDAEAGAVGPEVEVGPNNGGQAARVVEDGTGLLVVWSWSGTGTNGFDVVAQRVDAAGALDGARFVVNATDASTQDEVAAAALTSGTVVVWTDKGGADGSSWGVYARQIDASGTLGTEFRVNDTTSGAQRAPAVAALADGGYVVVWEDQSDNDGSLWGVYGKVFEADGTVRAAEFVVSEFTENYQWAPAVTATADGGFFVSYSDYFDDASGVVDREIAGRAFAADGTPLGGEARLTDGNVREPGDNAQVAGLTGGPVAFVYQIDASGGDGDGSGQGVFLRLVAPSGPPPALPAPPALDGLDAELALTEAEANAGPRLLDVTGVAVSDADSADFAGGRLLVRQYLPAGPAGPLSPERGELGDVSVLPTGPIGVSGTSVTFGGATIGTIVSDGAGGADLEVALGASATPAAVEALVEALAYSNPSDDPAAETTLAVLLEDGDGGTAPVATVRVTVAPEADGPRPSGPDERVNSFTPGGQELPEVAALGDGGWVVVWESEGQDGSSTGVYGQRYAADGTAVGGEFRANERTGSQQSQPAVAALADGGWAVAWYDAGAASEGYVRVRLWEADGAAGGEIAVPATTFSTQWQPDVAGFADGSFVVVWSAYRQATFTYDVVAQRFAADGTALGGEVVVAQEATQEAQPRIDALAGTDYVVTWQADGDVHGRIMRPDGTDGAAFALAALDDGTQQNTTVAALDGGGFVTVWEDNSGLDGSSTGIFAQRHDATGAAVGGQVQVNEISSSQQYLADVIALDGGGFAVAWSSYRVDGSFTYTIQAQVYDASGGRVDGEFTVSGAEGASNGYWPRLAQTASGEIVVVWQDDRRDGSSSGIFQQVIGAASAQADPVLEGLAARVTFAEADVNAEALVIDASLAVSDADSADFDGGAFAVERVVAAVDGAEFLPPDDASQDALSIRDAGTGPGQIGVSGATVTFGGVAIGTITSDGQAGAALRVALNAAATPEAVEALAESVAYANASDDPEPSRLLRFQVSDGDGGVSSAALVEVVVEADADAPEALGGPSQVNSYEENTQRDPAVAALAGGGHVVVWESYDQDEAFDYAIYAQVYGADGGPVGDEFRVSAGAAGQEREPSVAALDGGGFVVVYVEQSAPLADRIVMQRFDAAGAAVGAKVVASASFATSTQDQPVVAGLPGGGWAVAWRSWNSLGEQYDVALQRFDAAGAPLEPATLANAVTTGRQEAPAMAATAAGDLALAWTGPDASGNGVFLRVLPASGAPAVEVRVNQGEAASQLEPTVAALDGGGFVVAFRDDGGDGSGAAIRARLFDAAGAPTGDAFRVNDLTAGWQYQPSATALPGGGFAIAYWDQGTGDIRVQRYAPDGSREDGSLVVSDTSFSSSQPALAARDDGTLAVAWAESNEVAQRLVGDGADSLAVAAAPRLEDLAAQTVLDVGAPTVPVLLDPSVSLEDAGGLAGGTLRLATISRDASADDQLSLLPSARVALSGAQVSVDGTVVGTIDATEDGANGAPLTVALNAAATPEAVRLLVERAAYANSGAPTTSLDVAVSMVVTDGDGNRSEPQSVFVDVRTPPTPSTFTLDDLGPRAALTEAQVNAGLAPIDGAVDVRYDGAAGLSGGTLELRYDSSAVSRAASAFETLGVIAGGPISVSGADVSFDSTVIGTIDGAQDGQEGANLLIALAAGATAEALDALVEALGYGNASQGPAEEVRLTLRIEDGGTASIQRAIALDVAPEDDGGLAPLGGERQVNSETAGDQQRASVAALADGGYVIAWASRGQDSPANDLGVFAQRFDAAGQPVGPEVLVTETVVGNQAFPALVGLAGGGWAAFWQGPDASGDGIYGRVFDAAGQGGAEFAVNATTTGWQNDVQAVQLSNGNVAVAWTDDRNDGNGSGVYAKVVDAAGATVVAEFVVNTETTSTQWQPSLATNGAGFLVVWSSNGQDAGGYGVYGQRFAADGTAQGGEFLVNTTEAGSQTDPVVAELSGGGFVVVWEDDAIDGSGSAVVQQRFDASGAKVGGEEVVNEFASSWQWQQTVTALDDGGWLVGWADTAPAYNGYDVVAQQFAADGSRADAPQRVNVETQGTQDLPALATLSDGRVVAAWESQTSGAAGDGDRDGVFHRLIGTPAQAPAADPSLDGLSAAVTLDEAAVNAGLVRLDADGAVALGEPAGGTWDGGRLQATFVPGYGPADQFLPPDDDTQDSLGFASARVGVAGGAVSVDGTVVGALAADGADGAPLVVELNATATTEAVEALLEALALRNRSDDPEAVRDLRVDMIDGAGGVAQQVIAVTIAPEPDAPGAVEGERQVNSQSANQQDQIALAPLAGGGHVAVWASRGQDGGNNDFGVFGQLHGPDGQPVGPEFAVSATPEGSQYFPAVAGLASGGFVVAWEGAGPGDFDGVFAQLFDPGGAKVGGEVRLNEASSGTERGVALAAAPGGGVLAVWEDSNGDGSGWGVRGRLYDDALSAQTGAFTVNSGTDSTQWNPSVAALTDGRFVVAFDSYDTVDRSYEPMFRIVSAAGVPQGTDQLADPANVTANLFGNTAEPYAAALADGGFVIVMEDDGGRDGSGRGVYGQRFDAAGAAVEGPFLVNEATSSTQQSPVAVGLDDGGFVVAWDSSAGEDGSSGSIVAQRYAADGARLDGAVLVNEQGSGNQYGPALAALATGGFVAGWTSPTSGAAGDGSGNGVFSRLFGDAADYDLAGRPTLQAVNETRLFDEGAVNAGPQLLDADAAAAVSDPDGSGWAGGFVRADMLVTGTARIDQFAPPDDFSQDALGLRQADGIAIGGADVSVDGAVVGTITADGLAGGAFVIELGAGATTAIVERLVENLTYRNVSDDPEPARAVRVQVGDGEGELSDPVVVQVAIAPQADGAERAFAERQANTETANSQENPAVAAIDGGFVIAWQSWQQDGAGWGVYGQRFDALGNREGAEFLVNTTTSSNQLNPTVTGLDGGGFAVAWHDDNGASVRMQRYDATGATVSGEVVVSDGTGTNDVPSATVLTNGDLLLAWNDSFTPGGSSWETVARVFDGATGAARGSQFTLNETSTGTQYDVDVAAQPGGGFAAVWRSDASAPEGDGSGSGVFARAFVPDAVTPGAYVAAGGQVLVNASTSGSQNEPAIAALTDGRLVAVWTDRGGADGASWGVFARILEADGAPAGPEFRVADWRFGSENAPDVTALTGGGFAISWETGSNPQGSGTDVFVQQYDAAGNRIDAETLVNTETRSTQDVPVLAGLPNGGFVVAYVSETSGDAGDGSSRGVFYQLFQDTAPTVSDVTADGTEDQVLALDRALFEGGFAGGGLTRVRIEVLPASGELRLDGTPVAPGDEVTAAQLDAGLLTYAPVADFNGDDEFGWTGADAGGFAPSPALATIEVAPVNDPVGLSAGGDVTISEGQSLSRQLSFVDPDSDTYRVTVDYGDGAGAATFTTGSKSPFIGRTYTEEGSFTVDVSVDDQAGSVETASFTVTVENAAPNAANDFLSTDEDSTATRDLLSNDSDPGGDAISVTDVNGVAYVAGTAVTIGSGATVTIDASGGLVYDPTSSASLQALAAGDSVFDTFTYTISDGLLTDTATVRVTVSGANDNVVAAPDGFAVDEDSSVTGSVFADNGAGPDFDPEGDAISVIEVNGQAAAVGTAITVGGGGTLRIGSDGAFLFDAAGAYEELDDGETRVISFSYVVEEDGTSLTASTTGEVTITGVNDAPVARDDGTFTTAFETALAALNVLNNDFDPDFEALAITGVTQGANGAVAVNGDGTLSYTPDAGFQGEDSFTYTVTDGDLSDTATVRVRVIAPVSTAPTAVDDAVGTDEDVVLASIDVLANDTDPNGDTLSVAGVTQGANGAVTINGDGTLRYAPDANFFGTDSFTYTVSDGTLTDVGTVTVTVAPVDDAPVAADDSVATDRDVALAAIDVTANDVDVEGATLTITGVTQGANGTVAIVAGGTVSYTPEAGFAGTDSFTYTVSDGGLTDTATVTVTVRAVNDAPVAVDDSVVTDRDVALPAIDVTANDTDANGDTLAIESVTQGANGTVVIVAGGTLSYTPDAGFTGTDSFTYTITDGTLTDTATVDVTVRAVNDAPTAVDDSVATSEDVALAALAVLGNDTDPNGDTLSVSTVTQGANGAVAINGDGTLSYTPDAGFSGTDSFTYTVSDGTLTDVGTVTVTVAPVNDAPAAVDDSLATDEDVPLLGVDLLGNDRDPDGDTLTVAAVTQAANGTVTLNGDGTVSYAPDADFSGTDSFTYTITDGALDDAATVTVTVAPVNDAPVAADVAVTTDEDTALAAIDVLGGVADVDGGAPSMLSLDTTGLLGTATLNGDGTVGYDPGAAFQSLGAGDAATDRFAFTVSDGAGGTDVGEVVVTVTGRDEAGGLNLLEGTDGRERTTGTDGDDLVVSRGGLYDTMTGGGGADVFVFDDELSNGARDLDVILDFSTAEDRIVLSEGGYDVVATDRYMMISMADEGDRILVYGDAVDEADLNITVGDWALLL